MLFFMYLPTTNILIFPQGRLKYKMLFFMYLPTANILIFTQGRLKNTSNDTVI